ncbi:FecCD family ABC transporter permease [Aliamphritea hakodatensis]|uniref:FecCD family ABC transporter permease n=1 Tax=Aliamphritea hakodatensis TaxID=2895352 RepID=UPI0022FD4DFF|nr:iron ABC transporter permease [Aliamphritea hakodatensis]
MTPRLIFIIMPVLLILAMLGELLQGPAQIPVAEIISILLHSLGMDTGADIRPWMASILLDVRLPRVIIGACAGASLAVCGAVMQGMFRNPLASPSILGVSSGASLGAVIAIYLGLTSLSVWILPAFAFCGAGITLWIVYRIATQRGHTAMGTLLLAGVAIGALNVAAASLILALSLNDWDTGKMIVYWSMGGLEGRTWDHVRLIVPFALLGCALVLCFSRDLDALLMGEVHAASVGIDVPRTRQHLLIITAMLVGVSIAVCGGIGFIGLVVPHILRLILGPRHRYLLPASALGGAICLVAADLLLRVSLPEKAIPLGVVTATLGAPFFVFLLLRQRTRGQL